MADGAALVASHHGPAVEHPDAIYRRGDGRASRRRRQRCRRTGFDQSVALLGPMLGGHSGIFRAGGPPHRRQRPSRGARRSSPGNHGVGSLRRDNGPYRRSHRLAPAGMAGRHGSRKRQGIGIFPRVCGRAAGSHTQLPGERHAARLGQYEDRRSTQRDDVRARRDFQLLFHLSDAQRGDRRHGADAPRRRSGRAWRGTRHGMRRGDHGGRRDVGSMLPPARARHIRPPRENKPPRQRREFRPQGVPPHRARTEKRAESVGADDAGTWSDLRCADYDYNYCGAARSDGWRSATCRDTASATPQPHS